jgi:endoglycosylceramidase
MMGVVGHAGPRRRSGRLLVAMVAAVVVLASGLDAPAEAHPPSAARVARTGQALGQLHPDGRFLRDGQGRAVILHGLFGVWKTARWAPTDSDTDPAGFTRTDAAHVAALGFDVFRLAYFWEGLEPAPGAVSNRYLADIARVEHELAVRGVHVVIDSHQDMYSSLFYGDGFPAWAVHDDDLPLPPDQGFPLNYFTPAVERSFTNLWADEGGVLDAYDHQLAVVAQRFAHDPMVLGYDLMNEPFSGDLEGTCAATTGCPTWDATTLSTAEEGMARAVRSVTTDQFVFYEPQIFANWGTPNGVAPVGGGTGPNGFSFHDQCSARAYYQLTHDRPGALALEARICPAQNATVMTNALAGAQRFDGFPLMTEVAAATDDDYGGLECNLELADSEMVGWTYGLSWRSGELRHLDPTKQAVISRAYPQVVAGDPISYGFDPRSGDFHLSYETRSGITGQTSVWLPVADQYPGGYAVSVTGARVTSAAGASTLALTNTAGSHRVDVTVTPSPGGPPVSRPDLPVCGS